MINTMKEDVISDVVLAAFDKHSDEMLDLLLDHIDQFVDIIAYISDKDTRRKLMCTIVMSALQENPMHPMVDILIAGFWKHAQGARRLFDDEADFDSYPIFNPNRLTTNDEGLVAFGPILIATANPSSNHGVLPNAHNYVSYEKA